MCFDFRATIAPKPTFVDRGPLSKHMGALRLQCHRSCWVDEHCTQSEDDEKDSTAHCAVTPISPTRSGFVKERRHTDSCSRHSSSISPTCASFDHIFSRCGQPAMSRCCACPAKTISAFVCIVFYSIDTLRSLVTLAKSLRPGETACSWSKPLP